MIFAPLSRGISSEVPNLNEIVIACSQPLNCTYAHTIAKAKATQYVNQRIPYRRPHQSRRQWFDAYVHGACVSSPSALQTQANTNKSGIFLFHPTIANYPQAKFPGVVLFSEIYQGLPTRSCIISKSIPETILHNSSFSLTYKPHAHKSFCSTHSLRINPLTPSLESNRARRAFRPPNSIARLHRRGAKFLS